MIPKPTLTFWYEFASTYSWLAAERIEALAAAADVEIHWRAFLLGPIFVAQGWNSSPFNLYPAKGNNMWRDMERLCALMGLPPITRPEPFPQNSLLATRVATALPDARRPAFSRAVYRAEFTQGRSIADRAVIAQVLRDSGVDADADAAMAAAESTENKAALRAVTEQARSLGIYGAPSFTTASGELFWGNDRMEQALSWARKEGSLRGQG
jgi:2-hydroxychromene-2-carboxylate isomerase